MNFSFIYIFSSFDFDLQSFVINSQFLLEIIFLHNFIGALLYLGDIILIRRYHHHIHLH